MANTKTINPERISGHKLVAYLLENPEARGNFKWHTLLSCMWRDLLIAQPSFADVADFDKISNHDIYKIINVRPELSPRFDWKKMHSNYQEALLIKYPELANEKTTANIYRSNASSVLRVHPQLASWFKLEKLRVFDWIHLVSGQECFADQCPWKDFKRFDWMSLVWKKKSCLKFLKLELVKSLEDLETILAVCYLGVANSGKGAFEFGMDAATFLISKRMDRENGKRFLKRLMKNGEWSFIEEVANISPEDALDVDGKKYMPFFFTLMAPDSVFEKVFPFFDLKAHDPGGNSLLMAALVHSLSSGSMERYEFMLKQGLDPAEKNLAGFSCEDIKNSNLKG